MEPNLHYMFSNLALSPYLKVIREYNGYLKVLWDTICNFILKCNNSLKNRSVDLVGSLLAATYLFSSLILK